MIGNIGGVDRTMRLAVGVVLILLALLTGFAAATPWLWWASLAVGAVLIATSATGSCPAYALLGVNTCSRRR